jgi:hypothetical protein
MPAEYPLAWPPGWHRTDKAKRKRAQFNNRGAQVTYTVAEKRLRDELQRLCGCRSPIVSSNMLRSAQPDDVGVAVYFQAPDKPMRVIAVDAYDRVEDNIAAIAATIEAMRAIDRHGGAEILERAFTGFTALPPPTSAWEVLGIAEGSDATMVRDAYRRRARLLHDQGAPESKLSELNVARDEVLKLLGGPSR